jgi:dihydroorotase
MAADLVISGGTIVTHDAVSQASIAIADGLIVAVGQDSAMPAARETLDAGGLHVLPGVIDSHVHFREPGFTYKENWATGTAAAAAGGVTTVFEMPNTHPPTGTVEAFRMKADAAKRQAVVDYGIYGLLGTDNRDQLAPLAEAGVTGFKCFMGNTFGDLPSPDDGTMLEGFEIIAKLGLRCTVHAENAAIMHHRQQRMICVGREDPAAHLAARPGICELEAVSRAINFAEWTGCRLHIAHLSSGFALDVVRQGKRRGVDVTVETCPQYLLLNSDDVARLANIMRVNPPVREPGHAEPLWAALRDGTIDMMATDHAPHTPAEKLETRVWVACCGFPGVETALSLMLTEVARGRLSLTEYVRVSSYNPARAWGIYPTKGAIRPGSHADLALVDLAKSGMIEAAKFNSQAKISPYEGRGVVGMPIYTLVRGRIVAREGQVTAEQGWGKSVKPIQRMAPPAPRNLGLTSAAVERVGV